MKKIITLISGVLLLSNANAQPWMEGVDTKGPLNLEEIATAYKQEMRAAKKGGRENEPVEDGKYHFDRWYWYWKNHLDKNGNLVAPTKTFSEWQKWQAAEERSSKKTTSADAKWSFQGPDKSPGGSRGVGRINVVEFHPTDKNTYLIGSPGGGIWETNDDGGTWKVLNDKLPKLGVSDIAYNPLNPKTIYICSGDRNASDTYSMGIFKSTNGGITWDTTGFQFGFTELGKTNGIVINRDDTSQLVIATSIGIYKSDDAGATWTLKQNGFYQQLLEHPTNSSVLLAAGRENGNLQQVFFSNDAGETWTQTTTFNNSRRIELAATKINGAIIKAVVADYQEAGLEGIYHSSDTGKTFTLLFDGNNCDRNILTNDPDGKDCSGQAWYDLTIQISPVNSNIVVVGGVNTWYSTDGGSSWDISSQWTSRLPGVTVVHADKHFHKFHPLDPSILYECNDGGIFKSSNFQTSSSVWTDVSTGLGITQFYRNAVADVASFVIGGSQDNGTTYIENGVYDNLLGGDGMDCQIDPGNSDIFYASSQYGNFRRTTNGGSNFTNIRNNIPGRPSGAWITPLVISPFNTSTIYAGYDKLYMSNNRGDSWSEMPNLNFGSNNIDRITLDPHQDSLIAVNANNIIRYSTDYGNTWNSVFFNERGSVSDIMFDPRDESSLWVTMSGYQDDKVSVYDIQTRTWTKHTDDLPNIPVNCIEIDEEFGVIYIGTDLGVFYKEYDETSWKVFNNGNLPNVEVIDLGINHTTKEIWAATYGRSMWKSPVHKFASGITNTIPYADDVVTIAPNPNNGSFDLLVKNASLTNKQVAVKVISITGTTVWNNNVTVSSNGRVSVNAALPNGTYMVELSSENVPVAKTRMVVFN